MTAAELRSLLIHLLAGAAGGAEAAWSKRIGEMTAHTVMTHIQSNWMIDPTGARAEREAIAKAVELVRAEHPKCGSRGLRLVQFLLVKPL